MDLLSRLVIGWSIKDNPQVDLVIDALVMTLWRRKPNNKILIHSDQATQYTCSDWRKILSDHNLEVSMSRKENCHDNPVAENFFSLLEAERINHKIYKT